MEKYDYLSKINSPADVKALDIDTLPRLADDMRKALIYRVSNKGGHFGPNMGIVEIVLALHYVFDSPKDKLVFDVSHQCYPHKLLTGRKEGFIDKAKFDTVSGFTNPEESEHDQFIVGHTSTSVSLACGLAKARDLKKEKSNVIAIIGDGSLSGGEALEGIDFASELESNLIIIVNDNEMSIAENHGGLYKNLKQLRESNGKCECNIFRSFGLDYVYVEEGNDVKKLVEVFSKVKDTDHPIVVHVHTLKGKGYKFAETEKETWHWHMPFNVETGMSEESKSDTYQSLTADYLLDKMAKDSKLTVLTAGVPSAMGFVPEKRKKAGKQYVDVGIAEEHAIAMASGIAKNGGKVVFGTNSTFLQRTFDQIIHDLCMNCNPATILINSGSIYGMNDMTHVGVYDIPMLSSVPNLVYLSPTNKQEYFAMLDWSIEQNQYPVAIRIPYNGLVEAKEKVDTDYSDINRYKVTKMGRDICVIALGDFYQLGEKVVDEIKKMTGNDVTLVNPRFTNGVDEELLNLLAKTHSKFITLEDGILDGGFGEKIARFFGPTDVKVYAYGVKKQFPDRYVVEDFMRENGLVPSQIAEDVI